MDGSGQDYLSQGDPVGGADIGRRRAACLVLGATDRGRPKALLEGLNRRGARVTLLKHPAEVMVRLARCPNAAVVIDEPISPGQLAPLMAAVRRYYPKATCWRFDRSGDSGRGRLMRVGGDQSRGPALSGGGDAGDGGTRLRLADQRVEEVTTEGGRAVRSEAKVGVGRVSEGGDTAGSTAVVSAEELAMLMGSVSDEDGKETLGAGEGSL